MDKKELRKKREEIGIEILQEIMEKIRKKKKEEKERKKYKNLGTMYNVIRG